MCTSVVYAMHVTIKIRATGKCVPIRIRLVKHMWYGCDNAINISRVVFSTGSVLTCAAPAGRDGIGRGGGQNRRSPSQGRADSRLNYHLRRRRHLFFYLNRQERRRKIKEAAERSKTGIGFGASSHVKECTWDSD